MVDANQIFIFKSYVESLFGRTLKPGEINQIIESIGGDIDGSAGDWVRLFVQYNSNGGNITKPEPTDFNNQRYPAEADSRTDNGVRLFRDTVEAKFGRELTDVEFRRFLLTILGNDREPKTWDQYMLAWGAATNNEYSVTLGESGPGKSRGTVTPTQPGSSGFKQSGPVGQLNPQAAAEMLNKPAPATGSKGRGPIGQLNPQAAQEMLGGSSVRTLPVMPAKPAGSKSYGRPVGQLNPLVAQEMLGGPSVRTLPVMPAKPTGSKGRGPIGQLNPQAAQEMLGGSSVRTLPVMPAKPAGSKSYGPVGQLNEQNVAAMLTAPPVPPTPLAGPSTWIGAASSLANGGNASGPALAIPTPEQLTGGSSTQGSYLSPNFQDDYKDPYASSSLSSGFIDDYKTPYMPSSLDPNFQDDYKTPYMPDANSDLFGGSDMWLGTNYYDAPSATNLLSKGNELSLTSGLLSGYGMADTPTNMAVYAPAINYSTQLAEIMNLANLPFKGEGLAGVDPNLLTNQYMGDWATDVLRSQQTRGGGIDPYAVIQSYINAGQDPNSMGVQNLYGTTDEQQIQYAIDSIYGAAGVNMNPMMKNLLGNMIQMLGVQWIADPNKVQYENGFAEYLLSVPMIRQIMGG